MKVSPEHVHYLAAVKRGKLGRRSWSGPCAQVTESGRGWARRERPREAEEEETDAEPWPAQDQGAHEGAARPRNKESFQVGERPARGALLTFSAPVPLVLRTRGEPSEPCSCVGEHGLPCLKGWSLRVQLVGVSGGAWVIRGAF